MREKPPERWYKDFELTMLFHTRFIAEGERVGCLVRGTDGEYVNPTVRYGFVMYAQGKFDAIAAQLQMEKDWGKG